MIKKILNVLIRELYESLVRLSQGYIGCALSNYGEVFAKNVLQNFWGKAVTPAIANTDWEGEIKKGGDRVNVLMFLEDINMNDYTVGSDMATQHPVDTEASLIIDQKKYYNFDVDTVDKQFRYVEDEESALIVNAAKALEREVDERLLNTYIEEVAAGNRIPHGPHAEWTLAIGDAGTYITITTAASYGIATITGAVGTSDDDNNEEANYFPVDIINRGFRVMSDNVNSNWFKITTRTSSTVIRFVNWDQSALGFDPIAASSYVKFPFYADNDCLATSTDSNGCQIEGMKATQVTKTNIYSLVCDLKTCLDNYDVPGDNRHLTAPPWFQNLLIQASQLQPDIALYHDQVVINGKVGRVAGFDVHIVAEGRFSQDASPWSGIHPEYTGGAGFKILANHIGFITFAHAFTKSRVMEANLQFANLYQGLNLYGFKVMNNRRKCGAYLYGYA